MAIPTITRRRLLAASGATIAATSPIVLAACGTEEKDEATSPAREAELLNAILAQQLAVRDAAVGAARFAPAQARADVAELPRLREESAVALADAISGLEETAITEPAETVGGESAIEGLARQLEASLAVTIDAIAELNPEQRTPVQRAIAEDAAVLAVMRSVLGEEIAPDAFVMGPPAAHEEEAE